MLNTTPQNAPVNHSFASQAPVKDSKQKKVNIFYTIGLILLTVIILILCYVFIIPKDYIEIQNQPLGETFIVKKLIIQKPGMLSIRLANKYQKITTDTIAQSPILAPGVYNDISLDAFPNHPSVKPGDTLFAVIIDKTNTKNTQVIMTDLFGKELKVPFKVN